MKVREYYRDDGTMVLVEEYARREMIEAVEDIIECTEPSITDDFASVLYEDGSIFYAWGDGDFIGTFSKRDIAAVIIDNDPTYMVFGDVEWDGDELQFA